MDFWHYEFMRHALISALLLGPACGFLGVFVTLRGMSFFSDALSHAALTGVAIGFVLQEIFGPQLQIIWVVLLFSLLLAAAMAHFFERTSLRPDTVIALSYTGSVAFGVLVISKLGKYRLLDGILFGDIYANNRTDLICQACLAAAIFGFLGWNLKPYLLSIVQPDLARVEGARMERLNFLFALLIAATVTLCLKMLGALLLSGLIVIPPAAAKLVARNFRQMIAGSIVIGIVTAAMGVVVSYALDLPTGPTIIVLNVVVLLACYALSRFRR